MNLSPSAWIEALEKYLGQTKGWLQMHQRVTALEQRIAALIVLVLGGLLTGVVATMFGR